MAQDSSSLAPAPQYGAIRRDQLADTSDPRAVSTRKRLMSAFEDLIASGATSVTVTGLCKEAQVGRSTFYAHFRTVEDLIVGRLADIFVEGAEWDREHRRSKNEIADEITRSGLTVTVQRLQALRPLVAYATATDSRATLEYQLTSAVAEQMLPSISDITGGNETLIAMRANFLAAGLVRVTLAELDRPVDVARSDVEIASAVSDIVDMFPDWVTR